MKSKIYSRLIIQLLISLLLFIVFKESANAQGLSINDSLEYYTQKANEAYMNGEYQTAITLYKKIEENYGFGKELYYNMGNTYYKLNLIPLAILYYERAKRLDPSDENITYNLKIANLKIVDKIETLPEIFFSRWWKRACSFFTINQWSVIIVICSFLIFATLLGVLFFRSLFWRKLAFYFLILFIFIGLFAGIAAYNMHKTMFNKDEAIVFAITLSAKSSPDINSIDLFIIHEGLKVKITDSIGDWYEIKLPNGSRGWIQSQHVVII